MKPPEIEPGFYYEKNGSPGWLRLVLAVKRYEVLYVDFAGSGQCRVESFARWASRRCAPAEAVETFPKTVDEINRQIAKL